MQMYGRYKEHGGLLKQTSSSTSSYPYLSLYFDKEIHQLKRILTHFSLDMTYKKIVASRTAPLFDFVATRTVK